MDHTIGELLLIFKLFGQIFANYFKLQPQDDIIAVNTASSIAFTVTLRLCHPVV
jgi:hypothetical protein